jgi:hypothetical protein
VRGSEVDEEQELVMGERQSIPGALMDAYRRTEFRVADRGWSFVLRHDEHSKVLEECHRAFGVTCSAYITAWNPRSEVMSREQNEAAQARLEAEVQAAGLEFLRGIGVDPSGPWPGEPSVLVLGLSTDDAMRLGREYEQNAIVLAGRDAVPRLAMIRREADAGV